MPPQGDRFRAARSCPEGGVQLDRPEEGVPATGSQRSEDGHPGAESRFTRFMLEGT